MRGWINKVLSVFMVLVSASLCAQDVTRNDMIVEEVIINYEVRKVDGINSSSNAEFCPHIINEGEMIFVSSREYDLVNYGENRWNEDGYSNVFKATYQRHSGDSITFKKPTIFSGRFIGDSHSGPMVIHEGGKFAILTQVHLVEEADVSTHRPQLFISHKQDGKWTQPEKLPFVDAKYSFGHPAITPDSVLYFSSNIPGSKGGNDIFWSKYSESGEWSLPKSLGDSVNTDKNEVFPAWSDSTLYFSSDGHGSIGELDLFTATQDSTGVWHVRSMGETFNSTKDDFGICFNSTGDAGFFSSDRYNGSDDILRWRLVESRVVRSRILAGKFQYRKLSGENPEGMEVMLVDDNGDIQYTTLTDENGEFMFDKLPLDENFVIKVNNEDSNLELIIFNKDGEKVAYLLSDDEGVFVYKRLEPEHVGTLALIDQSDVDITNNTIDFSGQFMYENLPQDYPNGLKVMLVDDNGNVVYETNTDAHGNFNFSKLPIDENYILKVEEIDKDLSLIIYNDMNNVMAVLRMNDYGEFVFRKLSGDFSSNLSMLSMEDSDMIDDVKMTISGQFLLTNLEADYGDGLTFEVVNDDGTVIYESVTDKEGFFRLKNLPLTESYMFKIADDDPNFDEPVELVILNRRGKRVAMLDKDKKGYFVYSPLGLGGPIDLEKINMLEPELSMDFKVPMIYYASNSYRLSSKAKDKLKEVIETLKNNELLQLEVNSYADSRASEEYNLKLSGKRTDEVIEYLIRHGVPESRISGNAYGESNLINDCEDNVDCPDELHQLNRRTEFRIY